MTRHTPHVSGRPRRRFLSPLDAAWLLLESPSTPMHVGALMEFTAPADAGPHYLRQWRDRLRDPAPVAAPFNLMPELGARGWQRLPVLREAESIDLSHHVRLWGLPSPGGQRELGDLVSRLHGQQLDFGRPLWELHVIDGLEEDRFALYLKIHHSLTDGVSAMRHLVRTLSIDPDARDTPLLWTVPRPVADAQPRRRGVLPDIVTKAPQALAGIVRAGAELASGQIDGQSLRAPYGVPDSPLGAQINGHRRFATQSYELDEFRRVSKAAQCSINDLALYLCGTALRSYLTGLGKLPAESLTAGIPVSLREPGDERPGTSIGILVAALGTDVADPIERLQVVRASASAAKQHLRALPDESLPLQSALLSAPYIAGLLAGLGHHAPIPFSVGISNVPGQTAPLYFNGARLDGLYPVSLLTQGNALNITCVSHDSRIDFGFIGARDALPHLQRLAVAMGEAFDEIAEIFVVQRAPMP